MKLAYNSSQDDPNAASDETKVVTSVSGKCQRLCLCDQFACITEPAAKDCKKKEATKLLVF